MQQNQDQFQQIQNLSTQNYGGISLINQQNYKTLQKNYSTSTLHKAPLPPRLYKQNKPTILESNITTQSNMINQINFFQPQSQAQYIFQQDKQEQSKYWNIDRQIMLLNGQEVQKEKQNCNQSKVDKIEIRQGVNVLTENNGIPTINSISASGLQILPVSIDQMQKLQSGVVNSTNLNTPLYAAGLNTSPIKHLDLNLQYPSINNEKNNNTNEYHAIQTDQYNILNRENQQNQAVDGKSDRRQARSVSSDPFTITQPINTSDFNIDPNEQFMFKAKQQPPMNKAISTDPLQNDQFCQTNINPLLKINLTHTNMDEGGGSPFTLNKPQNTFQEFQPVQQQSQLNTNQAFQFSPYIPQANSTQNIVSQNKFINNTNLNEDILQSPIRASIFCEKYLIQRLTIIVQTEDYGNIQNFQNLQNVQDKIKQQHQVNRALEKNCFKNIDGQDCELKKNSRQNFLFAPNQNNQYEPEQIQNNYQIMNILSSINSNVTGQEQSPFCSTIMKYSDFIRRKTSIEDTQITNQDVSNLLTCPQNSKIPTSHHYKTEPINIIQNDNLQHQIQIAKKSESIVELNEEYSESIVIGNINEKENFIDFIREDFIISSHSQQPASNQNILVVSNNLQQQQQEQKQEDKLSYYLKKADEIIGNLEQNQIQTDFTYQKNSDNPKDQKAAHQIIPLKSNQYQIQNELSNNFKEDISKQYLTQQNIPIDLQLKELIHNNNLSTQQNNSQNYLSSQMKIFSKIPKDESKSNEDQIKINIIDEISQNTYDLKQNNKFNLGQEPVQSHTERRKANIDQIVQTCVERTQNLLEKLKSKQQKKQSNNRKLQFDQDYSKADLEKKSKRHEEMRQSKQKVDQLFNEALNRSRQVVQRHVLNKMATYSPPYFGKNNEIQEQTKNYITENGTQNNSPIEYSPEKGENSEYKEITNENGSNSNSGGNQKVNNTFGYYSYGTQNASTYSSSNPQFIHTNFQDNQQLLTTPNQHQIRLAQIQFSENKTPNQDQRQNSGNNSISFDIQAGNSEKSNLQTPQDFLSPKQKNLQEQQRQPQKWEEEISPSSMNYLQLQYVKGVEQQDGLIFDGMIDKNNLKQGYGKLICKQSQYIVYEGEWKNNLFHGQGILSNLYQQQLNTPYDYKDFNALNNYWKIFEGEFNMGMKNGSGTLTLTNEEKYSGKFSLDKINGEGVYYLNDNNQQSIVGQWNNNILHKLL